MTKQLEIQMYRRVKEKKGRHWGTGIRKRFPRGTFQ